MKRGQLYTKKKILIPTLTLVAMMFALGIGPASPQEVLAATSEPYIEMTVEMPTISKHETNLVKASNQTDRWQGSGDSWKLLNESRTGYVTNSWFQDLDGSWYMLSQDGTMYSGLVTDQSSGKSYLLNTNHDDTYGKMLTVNGTYTVNGKSVYLTFNQAHDGSYGAILTGLSEARSTGITEVALPSIPTESTGQASVGNVPTNQPTTPETPTPTPPTTGGGNASDPNEAMKELFPGWDPDPGIRYGGSGPVDDIHAN